jgi:hypothetical protein
MNTCRSSASAAFLKFRLYAELFREVFMHWPLPTYAPYCAAASAGIVQSSRDRHHRVASRESLVFGRRLSPYNQVAHPE